MLRSGASENKKLIHGVRFLNQFYFESEIEQSLGENYIRCCSRETGSNVYHGRVSSFLASLNTLPAVNYYLCGKEMCIRDSIANIPVAENIYGLLNCSRNELTGFSNKMCIRDRGIRVVIF